MKQFIVSKLDRLIPDDLKEFEQNEELIRARALVFVLLFNLLLSVLALIFSLIATDSVSMKVFSVTPFVLCGCIAGYFVALWIFQHSGLFAVSGNIFGLICYGAIMFNVREIVDQDIAFLVMILLFVPVMVSVIANHISGLVWLAIITVTPEVVMYFRNVEMGNYFTTNWLVTCFGIFAALYIGNYYRQGLTRRLSSERSQFEFAAAHDALTGLANRATFERRLHESIEYCLLNDTKSVLLYMDLDKFKPINDTYGHQAGDIVLSTIAGRLRSLVRRSDTVARLGGDEFAVLFDQCRPESIEPIIKRVAQVVSEPIKVFDNTLEVGCSVGMVVCPDDGRLPDQLSHKADERMYEAKRCGEAE